jgi:hypothetical protein|tara:strand:- start:528 stop:683 length:156 start_codon:yes stop_codon:yes gene_type:complete
MITINKLIELLKNRIERYKNGDPTIPKKAHESDITALNHFTNLLKDKEDGR